MQEKPGKPPYCKPKSRSRWKRLQETQRDSKSKAACKPKSRSRSKRRTRFKGLQTEVTVPFKETYSLQGLANRSPDPVQRDILAPRAKGLADPSYDPAQENVSARKANGNQKDELVHILNNLIHYSRKNSTKFTNDLPCSCEKMLNKGLRKHIKAEKRNMEHFWRHLENN